MINRLAAIARADTTRQAREEFDAAASRLRSARQAVTLFRNQNRIVDVSADLNGRMGVLGSLQEQLAEAMISYDMLGKTAQEGDPRLQQAKARIDVIEARIDGERGKLGGEGNGGRAFADLVGEYDGLQVDLEFAEAAYLSARGGLDAVLSEARRQNRYLAAFVRPTLAQASHQPWLS
jgi:capsular polysaccharide transport system permease protein